MFCSLLPGVTPPALALWDVDGDSVEDVLLSVTEWTNHTHPTQRNKSTARRGEEGFLVKAWCALSIQRNDRGILDKRRGRVWCQNILVMCVSHMEEHVTQ